MLLTLLMTSPHYTSYEALLASFTSLSPSDNLNLIHQAQQAGKEALRQELKPIYRTLSHIRAKLNKICPQLTITSIHEVGYIITSSSTGRDMPL